MEIKVNDKTLDVSLDKEKTLGDVLSGLEQWLAGLGYRISEINVDGIRTEASMIEEVFKKDINSVNCLDIHTNAAAELTAASLINLLEDIKEYELLSFEEKTKYFDKWKESATAGYIYSELTDLYAFCISAFSAGSMDTKTLISITEEIQREVNEPVNELINIEPVLKEICEKLTELPLDIQTGKEKQAAKTIQVFSAVTEKIFRIFRQLCIQGYLADEKPLAGLIADFAQLLKELLQAYEKNDSVLVGDITEYEASPKIKELYTAILENICRHSESKGPAVKE